MHDHDQAMSALRLANEVRLATAEAKRELRRSGRLEALLKFQSQLSSPEGLPEATGRMTIYHALMAIPNVGRVKAKGVVVRAGLMTGDRRLRDLTRSERRRLAAALDTCMPGSTRRRAA